MQAVGARSVTFLHVQMIMECENLFDVIQQHLFVSTHSGSEVRDNMSPSLVALVFGSTVINPKEVYVLRFTDKPIPRGDVNNNNNNSSSGKPEDYRSKMLRQLMQQASAQQSFDHHLGINYVAVSLSDSMLKRSGKSSEDTVT